MASQNQIIQKLSAEKAALKSALDSVLIFLEWASMDPRPEVAEKAKPKLEIVKTALKI